MKSQYFLLFCIFGTFFVSCNHKESLKNYMAKSWQTTYLKLKMPTYQKLDSLEIYEDKFNDNPKIIAQSKYNLDGTFSAWFINKKGEKSSNLDGKWHVKNDSLFVEFFYNDRKMKVSYHIIKTEEGFAAKSKYDWDKDGDFDDLLTMRAKQIKE